MYLLCCYWSSDTVSCEIYQSRHCWLGIRLSLLVSRFSFVIAFLIGIVQDTKRVAREESTGSTKMVAFPESDQEDRGCYNNSNSSPAAVEPLLSLKIARRPFYPGSQSPSSFGSSKENVPEICNNTASLQKGSKDELCHQNTNELFRLSQYLKAKT